MNKELKDSIDASVLCWLATVDATGMPNVSPKEMFTYVDDVIVIANIASPASVRNIKVNPQVCVSFIDIFKQKGYKVQGTATLLSTADALFTHHAQKLSVMAGPEFPFNTVITIAVEKVSAIIAPRYHLFPATTEAQQIAAAKKTYNVQDFAKYKDNIVDYVASATKQFAYYKWLGEKTLEQISDDMLFHQPSDNDNSIAMIINHLSGNMLSRWTDFLTTDGEKSWRNREQEFEAVLKTREDVQTAWDKGWHTLFEALATINTETFETMIYIRNMGHTVTEAVNRQLCHYAYHIGQIVLMGKQLKGSTWVSLSIPKGQSNVYNAEKFQQEKRPSHFTEEFIKRK
ncbi:MAG: DUF1572 family protein [Saprospiraceae bacterium]